MVVVDAKQLARAGYTYLGRLYSEMDCQAFVERCLRDCGLKMDLPGSNAWYRKMTWTGSPEECKKRFGHIPAGAFLFILEQDGKEPAKYRGDGIGNASHIGIYTAERTGAIHSSASKGCVVESRFTGKTISGGWNRVGLWEQVAYDVDLSGGGQSGGGGKPVETIYTAKVTGGGLNMRQQPATGAGKIMQIPDGATVEVAKELDGWAYVTYAGRNGWVMLQYLGKGEQADGGTVTVPRDELEKIYDMIGNYLGLRG